MSKYWKIEDEELTELFNLVWETKFTEYDWEEFLEEFKIKPIVK